MPQPVPNLREGKVDAARLLQALGRIGYHPVSALLDIVDNAISAAKATAIQVNINVAVEKSSRPGRPKASINRFDIIDNGEGMDAAGLENALCLGSSAVNYNKGTLSKFGMGLKSAASSLGRILEITSRSLDGVARKVVIDHSVIEAQGRYVYAEVDPSPEDIARLQTVTSGGSGTMVSILSVHTERLPSVSEIWEDLQKRAGVVYYYFLRKPERVSLTLARVTVDKVETAIIKPLDPLFVEEIDNETGKLDERNWDGLSVKWIKMAMPLQLEPSGTLVATVEMTQLPHPPSLEDGGKMSRKEARDKYLIEANNYGFYIYRNERLISWADRLNGVVPQDQDLYSFRGRILLESDADELLNIDVTKSRIHLSEMAQDQLLSDLKEALKKSRAAWSHRKTIFKQKAGEDPHNEINQDLNKIAELAQNEEQIEEDVATPTERHELSARRKKAQSSKPATSEESDRLKAEGERVQYVSSLDNNQLWERASDPQFGLIVRVNQSHRFYREIIQEHYGNSAVIRALDVLFYALARAEYRLIYSCSKHKEDLLEEVMAEYRERVGGELSDIVRMIGGSKLSTDTDAD